jgi:predicted dehydrogenase
MSKYKVGLVGVARGSGTVAPFGYLPETEISALCDLNETRLVECAQHFKVGDKRCFTDFDQFLTSDVDIVVVGTPIQFHAEQVLKALQAGKHVLSEVTMAYKLEDCQRIIDTVKAAKKTYMLGENCCYWPFIRQWDEWIKQGLLGDIFYAEAEYIHNIQELLVDEKNGETFWRLSRPPIYYCTHSLGPILMMTGDRITSVSCVDAGYSIMPPKGEGCLNMEVALFKTQKGKVIKLLRSQVAYREPPLHFYSLYGTKGVIESDRRGTLAHAAGGTRGLLHLKDKHYWVHKQPEQQFPFDEIYTGEIDLEAPVQTYDFDGSHGSSEHNMIRAFIDAVQTGTQPFLDAPFGASITAPGLVAHESAKQGGQWLDVPVFTW